MDGIDIMYFILNNMTSIIAIVIIIGSWFWNSAQRNAELKMEEERRIVEFKRQEESIQMAIEKFQRERNQYREKEMQIQKHMDRIEMENQYLRNSHTEMMNQLIAERRSLHAQILESNRTNKNHNDDGDVLKNIGRIVKIIGGVTLAIMAGKQALK